MAASLPEVECMKEFLLWAREHRVQVTTAKLGEFQVELTDMALLEAQAAPVAEWKPELPDAENMYEALERQYGMAEDVKGDEQK